MTTVRRGIGKKKLPQLRGRTIRERVQRGKKIQRVAEREAQKKLYNHSQEQQRCYTASFSVLGKLGGALGGVWGEEKKRQEGEGVKAKKNGALV